MKQPLVLIVGRPNVGKSTLFNRLTKSKLSIVDDSSGVTRDRLYGEVEWSGQYFQLIDTGGYVPNSDDKFEIAIKEQIEIALTEADAILFVVDGRVGVTPVDETISRILHRSKKPVFVLVNKTDNSDMVINTADFYSMGLENVHPISALNGHHLGDFLDDLTGQIAFPEEGLQEDSRLRIALIGKPNVGKSSVTNALLGYDRTIVTNIPGTTRDSIDSTLKFHGEEIVLVDTAGLRRKTKVKENIEFYSNVRTYRALASSDVSILLIDAELGIERQDLRIMEEAIRRRKGLILAVNKWDLIEKDSKTAQEFEKKLRDKIKKFNFMPIIFISALTKQRIFKLIELAKTIKEERKKKIETSVLNEVLLPELEKTRPPATPTGKEVKIKYCTQVGDKYPIFLFFANNSKYIPPAYIRFVEKLIRSNFGFVGVPITLTFKDK